MRIVYLGNFKPQHSTETHIAKTLENMGHDVLRVQEDEFTGIHEMAADLLLWTRTWPGHVKQADLDWCKSAGVPTASIHLDLYIGISRERDMDSDPFWRTDYVFTPDGDPRSAEVFKRKGINHHWLPAAVFKPETKKGDWKQRYACDVGFIGSYEYHKEWPYRHQLIDWLEKTYGQRFKLFGPKGHPYVRNQDLNDAFASIKVVVGDSLCQDFKHEKYWSDRIYETTGRGGFIIHPYIKGLETQFKIPAEVVCYRFGDFEYLEGLINFYLDNDVIREKLQSRAMKRTRRDHTYNNRMEEMLSVIAQ